MIASTQDLSSQALAGFSAVIDVRSPSEFALDHLPGATNLPVLDDAQRAEVGTEYVQGSKFRARRIGATHVARNIAAHLEGALAEVGGDFQPLIYCWRGGQRSHAMATILDQVGWRVTLLQGGYQTWRRQVVAALYDQPLAHQLVLLDGKTGVGKTAMLGQLAGQRVQTLDLEALANHRGSLFGAMPGGQPSQKLFDSRLMAALSALDSARPVVVEAESSRVGRITLPKSLWQAMQAAPVIELTASLDDRVARTLADYAAFATDLEAIAEALRRLPRHISKAQRSDWLELAQAGQMEDFVRALLVEHYDPAYGRGGLANDQRVSADDVGAVIALIGS